MKKLHFWQWAAIGCLVFLPVTTRASCVDIDSQPGDALPGISEKKADYAIAAISDAQSRVTDPKCVAANIRYLGLAHVDRAVPALVAMLGYKVPPQALRKPTNDDLYPAIGALVNIGEPAVPALIEVLASKDNDSIESKNAIDSLMDMRVYRDNLNLPLRAIKRAADKENDPIRSARLHRALQDARNRWCNATPCTQ